MLHTRTKRLLMVAALASGMGFALAPANAAPVLGGLAATDQAAPRAGGVGNVHWRRWRHCHWRYGWRRCHGGWRGWRRGPGIHLYIGPRRRWRRRWY